MKTTFILLFNFLYFTSFTQIKKVEPAFWWKDMKNPELQLLIYGKDISLQDIQFSNGVEPIEIKKVENPNYLFVTINTKEIKGNTFEIIIKKNKKVIDKYSYKLFDRKPNSAIRKSFTSQDIMYLIMPDRFSNGDETNDTVANLVEKANRLDPSGRHGGDLRGIIQNLDYLQNLGVTALWLTPANEDNEKSYSYHGYAQTDLYKIDSRYGTNEEYLELSRELQKRGMMLIQDYVTNHWGISHWLIQDLPTSDWIHQFPNGEEKYGFKRSNYRTTTQFDSNAAKIDQQEALNGWFDTTMPDLNQANPLVLNYLIQNAIWWIEYAELGGLRVDTYPYNHKESMAKWAKAITDEYPNINIVGEAWMYDPAHISYWQKNSKIAEIDEYNSHLPSIMDFTLFSEIPPALSEKESWDKGMIKIYNALGNDFLYPNPNNMLVFFENHDTERLNEIVNSDFSAYQFALTLISTIRGIPQLYYGSEIGMRGQKQKGDADIRRDFPGGWKSDSQDAFQEKSRTKEQNNYFNFTQKILQWRKNKTAIHQGKTKHYAPKESVYVYFRENEKEKIMVILNNNSQSQILDLSRFSESIEGVSEGKEIITNKTIKISTHDKINIPPKTPMIIELH